MAQSAALIGVCRAGPISAGLVRQIACDATVTRIVLDPRSQPLDVGRSTRVVPAGLRKALLLRDKRCRYPGCDVPGVWCDAHYLRHWAVGGVTALNKPHSSLRDRQSGFGHTGP